MYKGCDSPRCLSLLGSGDFLTSLSTLIRGAGEGKKMKNCAHKLVTVVLFTFDCRCKFISVPVEGGRGDIISKRGGDIISKKEGEHSKYRPVEDTRKIRE